MKFSSTPRDLSLEDLQKTILEDLRAGYDPDVDTYYGSPVHLHNVQVLQRTFQSIPFTLRILNKDTTSYSKEKLNHFLADLKKPTKTPENYGWRPEGTDSYYWDIEMAHEVASVLNWVSIDSQEFQGIVREVSLVFLNKVANVEFPSVRHYTKDSHFQEHKDERVQPQLYAVYALIQAYDMFGETEFIEQAINQAELMSRRHEDSLDESFKIADELTNGPATLNEFVRDWVFVDYGQIFKIILNSRIPDDKKVILTSEYEKACQLALELFRIFRENRKLNYLTKTSLPSLSINDEIQVLHLLLPEFHWFPR